MNPPGQQFRKRLQVREEGEEGVTVGAYTGAEELSSAPDNVIPCFKRSVG